MFETKAMTEPKPVSVGDLLKQVRASFGQKDLGWGTFRNVDVGANPGELMIVAGRTGHGKSTVLLNILLHWLETYTDQSFVLFSYEIPPTAVVLKLISMLTRKHGNAGWSYHEVRRWVQEDGQAAEWLDRQELAKALERMTALEQRLIVIYEPDWPVTKIAATAKDMLRGGTPIGAVFVDYLQLVPPPPGTYERREHEVTAVAKELKLLGVNAKCPVIAAAQIGREIATNSEWIPDGSLEDEKVLRAIAKRRPQLHHLREGGGENEADLVIGLLNYRADYLSALEQADIDGRSRIEAGGAGPFDLAVLKNRYGQLAVATLVFESRTGYIRDPGVFGR